MLILVSSHSACATPRWIEYFRSISSGLKSVSAVPSFTEPCRFVAPDTKASASTRLVLPLAPCPTTATFLMSAPWNSRMRHLMPSLSETPDSGRGTQPLAQRVVAHIGDPEGRVDGHGAHGLP